MPGPIFMLIPFDTLFTKYQIRPPGVLHLGANSGQEAEAYYRRGIRQVIWVEALPEVYIKLRKHIAGYFGQVALLACVSDKNGDLVSFNIASNEAQSSSMLEFGTHSQEHPTVKFVDRTNLITTRVDTLLSWSGLDEKIVAGWFLNVDLQGAELLALKGMGRLIDRFDHVYIEVNEKELYKGCPLVGEIDAFLAGRGFVAKEVKMTGSGWGDKYYQRV